MNDDNATREYKSSKETINKVIKDESLTMSPSLANI